MRCAGVAGIRGRIDHLDINLEGNRLFVAAPAAGSLEVINLRAALERLYPCSQSVLSR